MTPRQPPEQQAPPVQKLRIRYAKTGRARFASHRDFSRAFERALRRAGVPMAYSSGFSPHPRISYANASPTGAATDAEYLEIGLARAVDPGQLRNELNAALPDGLVLQDVVEAGPGSLADGLTASVWEIDLGPVPGDVLAGAVAGVLVSETLPVQRMTKTGMRDFDARPAILALAVIGEGTLRLLVEHQAPLVRPDDVVQALTRIEPACQSGQPAMFHRRYQGSWDGQVLLDPFNGEPLVLT